MYSCTNIQYDVPVCTTDGSTTVYTRTVVLRVYDTRISIYIYECAFGSDSNSAVSFTFTFTFASH